MRFTKMHALGNDFIALNGFDPAFPFADGDLPALAETLCDRHTGIGADGLFAARPSTVAAARMRFYNPDGTEDRCGNGLRCFGRFLHDEAILRAPAYSVETFGGTVDLRVNTIGDRVSAVTVNLGAPVLDAPRIPMLLQAGAALDVPLLIEGRTWRVNVVSPGTPHAVLLVDALPDEATFLAVSPRIETHSLFPEKTSVMWAHFVSEGKADVRIWERATGETLGCGTGAAAVAVAGRLRGVSRGIVAVRSRGGEVVAAWDGADRLTLTGPAHTVYMGEWAGNVSRD